MESEQITTEFKKIDISLLNPHDKNKEIYGDEDIKDLAEKIKQSEWIKPIIINKDNTIISGHRRYLACLSIGIQYIPFYRELFKNSNDELERLLLENHSREKTVYQKMKEAQVWEGIEKIKAKERQLSNLTNQNPRSVHVNGTREKGDSRDKISNRVGMSSSTYERAKAPTKEIERLEKEGKKKDAKFLEVVLNSSAIGAKDITDSNIINDISEELKDEVIQEKIIVKNAMRKIREEHGIVNGSVGKIKCEKVLEDNNKINTTKYSSNPKDIYGNEIKIDYEKMKNIDINKIISDVKDTNKNISDMDYESTSMEFECNCNMFVSNINRYIDDDYKLKEIDNQNQKIIMESIIKIENKLKEIKIMIKGDM